MQAKALEIRDDGTFIAALAVDMNPGQYSPTGQPDHELFSAQRYLLRRSGYACDGEPNVILTRLDGNGQATNDYFAWPGPCRTWPIAHRWIIENWHALKDGDVVDVEFILGETPQPKVSEKAETGPL